MLTLSFMWFSDQLVRSPLPAIDNVIDDLAVQIRGSTGQDNFISHRDITIIDIDDYSISQLGRVQFWPRKYDAKVLDYISSGNPRLVIFDVLYTEADTLPGVYAEMLRESGFQNATEIIHSMSTDHFFAESIKNAGNVILGMFDDERVAAATDSDEDIYTYLPDFYADEFQSLGLFQRSRLVLPVREFTDNALSVGLLKVNSDIDGTIRRYTLLQRSSKTENDGGENRRRLLTSIVVPAALHALDLQPSNLVYETGRLHIGSNISIPVDNRSQFRLNWLGRNEGFRYIPFANVFNGLVPAEYFEDKIVFIGSSAAGLEDLKNTPISDTLPGVEVHATALYNILNGTWLRELSPLALNLLLIFSAVVFSLIFLSLSQVYAFAAALLIILLQFFGYVLLIFPEFQLLLPISGLILLTISSFIVTLVIQSITEGREKAMLKGAFASYVSPEIVNQLIQTGEDPKLGGNETEITAFFSDIQSFSQISEKLTPKELVELMNEYLDAMTTLLNDEKGTLDKYIGDAIVAFFGAPLKVDNHALRACVVSQRMLKAQDALIARWKENKKEWPEDVFKLKTRIGINTGIAVTGNMGSRKRFNYTMMGDTVNLAARCESGSKHYGVFTMVTQHTKDEAEKSSDACLFRALDKVKVKGRNQPVMLYEVMCLKEDATDAILACKTEFEAGLQAYFDQNWPAAMEHFKKSAELEPNKPNPDDGVATNPSLVLLNRTREMAENPPHENWDGVYAMTQK